MDATEILKLARFSVERAEDAALWMDKTSKLLYANPAACRMLGYTQEELVGLHLFDITADITPALWPGLWKDIEQRDSFTFELSYRTKEGKTLSVEMAVHYFQEDGKEYCCVFARPVGERHQLESIKTEFVSVVSHELRTPMAIIREGVSQVVDGIRGEINEGQRRALSLSLKGIDRLSRLINDVLDVSKIEAGRVELRKEPIDMVMLVREIALQYTGIAKERGLDINLHFSDPVLEAPADRDKMIQVLTNLIDNALKFTEKGGIDISLAQKDGVLECKVEDTGLGIAPENIPKTFHKFMQFERLAVTGEKGTGLGLAICKAIIELHKGKIWVESELNKKTAFIFTLPCFTPKDIFKERLQDTLQILAAEGATLSTVFFMIHSVNSSPVHNGSPLNMPLIHLENLIHAHSGRKTDILVKDRNAVWLAMPSTVKKEALRVAQNIVQAFKKDLSKEGLDGQLTLEFTLTSFPEDAVSPKEFMDRALTV